MMGKGERAAICRERFEYWDGWKCIGNHLQRAQAAATSVVENADGWINRVVSLTRLSDEERAKREVTVLELDYTVRATAQVTPVPSPVPTSAHD